MMLAAGPGVQEPPARFRNRTREKSTSQPSNACDPTRRHHCGMPAELAVIGDETPRELRNVIQRSLEDCLLPKSSKSKSAAIVVRTTIETNGTKRREGERVIAQCTANVSARSSPTSDRPEERAWSRASARSTATTTNSEDEQKTLKLPSRSSPASRRRATEVSSSRLPTSNGRLRSRTDSPRTQHSDSRMAALESKLQASRDRTLKSEQLYKLIPVPMTEMPPSPSFFYPQDQKSHEILDAKYEHNLHIPVKSRQKHQQDIGERRADLRSVPNTSLTLWTLFILVVNIAR